MYVNRSLRLHLNFWNLECILFWSYYYMDASIYHQFEKSYQQTQLVF